MQRDEPLSALQIQRDEKKIMVRVSAKHTSLDRLPVEINVFKNKYTEYLTEAKNKQQKVYVLFDLRGITKDLCEKAYGDLKDFLSETLKPLSESVVKECFIVVSDEPTRLLLQGYLLLAGSAKFKTHVQCSWPQKKK